MRDHQDVKILDGGVVVTWSVELLQHQQLVVLQHVVQTLTAVQVIGFAKMEPVLEIHVLIVIDDYLLALPTVTVIGVSFAVTYRQHAKLKIATTSRLKDVQPETGSVPKVAVVL
jgi:hypothetical protein